MVAQQAALVEQHRQESQRLFLFQPMTQQREALDHLGLTFEWGEYHIHLRHFHLSSFTSQEFINAHAHSDYEFHFIPDGYGEVCIMDQLFPLHPGMLYLTGPGVVHSQQADRYQPMQELCLHINIERNSARAPLQRAGEPWEMQEADECLARLACLPARPSIDRGNAMHWFLVAYRAWQENQLGLYTTIKHSIIQILLRTVQAYEVEQRPPRILAPSVSTQRCQQAVSYIHNHYARPLLLEEVAAQVGVSPRQLQRIFHEQTDSTFTAYLEQHRLAQVCTALTQSNASIAQLALDHGFANSSHLHMAFKKRLGVTPSEFRTSQGAPKVS